MTKKYEENVHYRFVPHSEHLTAVELLFKPYENVVYFYGVVSLDQNGDTAVLHFDYDILNIGQHTLETLKQDHKFHIIIGDILTDLLTEKVMNEEIRKDDPKEFDLQ